MVFEFLRDQSLYLLMLLSIGVVHVASFLGRRAGRVAGIEPAVPGAEPLPEWMTRDLRWERLLQERADLALTLIALTLIGLIVLMIGVFRLASLLDRWRRGAARPWPGQLAFQAPWGVGELVRMAIVVAFVAHIVVMGQTVGELFHPGLRLDEHAHMLVNTMMIDLLVLLGVWRLMREHRLSWRRIGLSLDGLGRSLREAFVGYITAAPVLIGVLLATMTVIRIIGWEPSPQPVFELLYAESRPSVVSYAMWMVMLLGPIVEEIFFRGVAYTALKPRVGVGWAIVLSAFIFSLLHVDPVGFAPIMVLGMLLAYLYEQTGSLISPIVVHVMHNSLMVMVVCLVRAAIQAAT